MINKEEKLLILDLDETLIYASNTKLAYAEDFQYAKYFVYKRPFLEKFLIDISKHYEVGIWSSADDNYVAGIVNHIKPDSLNLLILWGRSRCSLKRDLTYDTYNYEKRLNKLKNKGYRLEQIIIVDDTPEKSRTNYGNAIYISEFTGDPNDRELLYLQDYLLTLKTVEDIRTIEKRGWRSKHLGL